MNICVHAGINPPSYTHAPFLLPLLRGASLFITYTIPCMGCYLRLYPFRYTPLLILISDLASR
jgi:hypothetical protein